MFSVQSEWLRRQAGTVGEAHEKSGSVILACRNTVLAAGKAVDKRVVPIFTRVRDYGAIHRERYVHAPPWNIGANQHTARDADSQREAPALPRRGLRKPYPDRAAHRWERRRASEDRARLWAESGSRPARARTG